MLVSGRNNVKEILKNFEGKLEVKKVILQENFNEKEILSLVKKLNCSINYAKKEELDTLVKNNHQGVILEVGDYHYVDLDDIIANKSECVLLILDHLEDPHNLGAIIRTAEASGIDGIILPKNRSVGVNETVMKTSVGALYNVKICMVTNLNNTIKYLKKQGFWLYGADMNGTNFQEMNYAPKTAIVIGNEGKGLARIVEESCDYIISIPIYGKVDSLNASVAAGILIYEAIKGKNVSKFK